MIAKLIGTGEDREQAIGELASMLDFAEIWPVRTNAGFLLNAILHPEFESGAIDTGFIERNLAELIPGREPSDAVWRGAAAVALAAAKDEEAFAALSGFRLNSAPQTSVALSRGGRMRRVSGEEGEIAEISGFRDDERVVVFTQGQAFEFALASRGTGTSHGLHDGEIEAPMPGKVTAVEVKRGEKVFEGQRLLTLEAMKMEHALTAPFDGTVTELNAKPGAQVTEGTLLVKVEAEPSKP
jgi:3-methylcrotonyl-CoA carboxylase alpha subunit